MRLPKNLLSETYRPPAVYLCQTNKDRIGELNVSDFSGTFKWNAYSEIEFSVDREYCDVNAGETLINPYYDLVEGLRLIEVEGFGYFQLQDPEIESDGIKETKHINANSLEYDLSNRYLENFVVNMGTDNSVEVNADGTVTPVVLYNIGDTEHSLLHLILAKAPDWHIGYVDTVVIDDKGTTFNNQQRSFEIDRSSIYDFLMNDVCETFRCVIEFNTWDNSINVYSEQTAGESADVVISFENLANEITVDYALDDIKTVLTVKGADDINIREVNYGLPYITNLEYYRTPEWMGQELYDHYTEYLSQFTEDLQDDYSYLSLQMRELENEISHINYHYSENLNSSKLYHFLQFLIKYFEEKVADEELLKVLDTDFEYLKDTWTSFRDKMTNKDVSEEDKEQAIEDVLVIIFKEYSMSDLKNSETYYKKMQTTQVGDGLSDVNDDHYGRYLATYTMLIVCQYVISERQAEIDALNIEMDQKAEEINELLKPLDMSLYLTEEDMIRLAPFLREDEYVDDNFVITEYDTEDEIQKTLMDLLKRGRDELEKISQPRLSFSTSIANIFALDEFSPIVNQFQLGNTINVVLRPDFFNKPRLLEVKIDFDNLDDFSVEFGEVFKMKDQADIHVDLLATAISAGKSVANNSAAWSAGANTASAIQQSISAGLLDSVTEIKSTEGIQHTVVDQYGIHLRTVKDGVVSPEQGWITSNKFVYSDDGFKTSKSVFGKFTHNGVTRYGIIAEALIGGYIEGTEIEGGSLKIGKRPGYDDDDPLGYALIVTSDGQVQINEWGGELEHTITQIESNAYDAILSSTTTPIFSNNIRQTIITCDLYRNNESISPSGTTYSWIRVSNDIEADKTWNTAHASTTTNTITIVDDDVGESAQFICQVSIPNVAKFKSAPIVVIDGANISHTHSNKAELDLIKSGDKAKWDAAAAKVDAIESGQSAELVADGIWTYRKWTNGVAECWGTVTGTTKGSEIEGFDSYGFVPYEGSTAFPTDLFIERPNVQYQIDIGGGFTMAAKGCASTNENFVWAAMSSVTEASNYTIDVYAIGKWQ